ncbi:L-lactate dehydrogenase A chain-like isoform X3 [Nasonia vitripennis]|uniref:Lactate/malate dehydrogenase N-terminal domain-containing protein n=1 Tax=Nasonia vitripennis TaxID=7425 RepID=A0A7M7R3R3_NASVI|nr:L-lactate dehydrogenase A chain-like isoform X3 [Nasonia vitripennis]
MMNETQENVMEKAGMARFLLSRPVDCAGSSSDSCTLPRTKIVIVGSGPVGVAVAVGLLFKRLAAELILMDENPEMARAEAEDIAAAAVFLGSPKIRASTDYSEARDATLCVIAAGRQQRDEADAEAVLQQNALLLKELVPSLTKYAPNSVLLVVSEPVDVLSHLAMKLSGFPSQRVLGLGTLLDNCRLQHELAKELGVNQAAVHSMVIAESGPTSGLSSRAGEGRVRVAAVCAGPRRSPRLHATSVHAGRAGADEPILPAHLRSPEVRPRKTRGVAVCSSNDVYSNPRRGTCPAARARC